METKNASISIDKKVFKKCIKNTNTNQLWQPCAFDKQWWYSEESSWRTSIYRAFNAYPAFKGKKTIKKNKFRFSVIKKSIFPKNCSQQKSDIFQWRRRLVNLAYFHPYLFKKIILLSTYFEITIFNNLFTSNDKDRALGS